MERYCAGIGYTGFRHSSLYSLSVEKGNQSEKVFSHLERQKENQEPISD